MNTQQILALLKAPIDLEAKIAKAAHAAVKEQDTLNLIEKTFREGGYENERPLTLKDGRTVTVLVQQYGQFVRGVGMPDKPGTVRKPGARMASSPKRYQMWANT